MQIVERFTKSPDKKRRFDTFKAYRAWAAQSIYTGSSENIVLKGEMGLLEQHKNKIGSTQNIEYMCVKENEETEHALNKCHLVTTIIYLVLGKFTL